MARRHWLQFRLRTLMFFITVLSLCLGRHVERVHRQRAVAAEVHRRYGRVAYGHHFVSSNGVSEDYDAIPPGPAWLRRIVGDDFFARITQVQFGGGSANSDRDLECLAPLTDLEGLVIPLTPISDAGLRYLARFRQLRCLYLVGTRITDEGASYLRDLRRLEYLTLTCPNVTDAGLCALPNLGDLQYLDLTGTQITDETLARLTKLANLRCLQLVETRVTDAGLDQLSTLKQLAVLDLQQTATTREARRILRQRLPRCMIWPPDEKGYHFPAGTTLGQLRSYGIEENWTHGLCLAGAAIDDDAMCYIATCPNLQQLDLRDTCISDEGLAYLPRLPNLENLYLERTRVSDTGLRNLAGLKKLQTVYLGGTRVTPAGLEALRRTLPNCQVRGVRVPRRSIPKKRMCRPAPS